MPAGRESPFTAKQREVIRSYYPAWRDVLRLHDPHFSPNNNLHTSDWRNKTASEIMKHPAFAGQMKGTDTLPIWEKKIRGCFTTERTRLRRAKLDGLCKTGTNVSQHDPKACSDSLRELSKALVSLRSLETNARAVFRQQNDQAIRLRAREIDSTSFGAAYQVALKELWAAADHDVWNEKARADVDVYSNQKEFGPLIYEALKALCQLGHLGETEMVLLYAFRDENDELSTHAVHAHSLSNTTSSTFDLGLTKHAFASFCQAVISSSTPTEDRAAEVACSASPETNNHEEPPAEQVHKVMLTQSTLMQSVQIQKQDAEDDAPQTPPCSRSVSSSSETHVILSNKSPTSSVVCADALHAEEGATSAAVDVEDIADQDTVTKAASLGSMTRVSETPESSATATMQMGIQGVASAKAPNKLKRHGTQELCQPRTSTRAKGVDLKLLHEHEKEARDKRVRRAWSGPGSKGYWTFIDDDKNGSDSEDRTQSTSRRVRRRVA